MADDRIEIHEDIRRASTMPAAFYRKASWFERAQERIFSKSWQFVTDLDRLKTPGTVWPHTLLEGCLDEPVLLTRDADDQVHCFSNVCTHRGNLLCEGKGHSQGLRCRYHGRRFSLDGKFQSMPGFDGVADFPTAADDLPKMSFGSWDKLVFASVKPAAGLDATIGAMKARCGWLPLSEFVFDPALSREYLVRANWALYCDNYLEGFHIPYVHPALSAALDAAAYWTELHPNSVLQLGVAASAEDAFDLPASSPDRGQPVAAFYWWLFPNTMFNFYPWGLSINVVRPIGPDRTKVSFLSYVWDRSKIGRGAGAALDRVEREDEDIVERVQQGVRSRSYDRGRYSPQHETGVHHFHRMIAAALA